MYNVFYSALSCAVFSPDAFHVLCTQIYTEFGYDLVSFDVYLR